ncbi:MAG TPA: hypothetical protein VFV03_03855 [Solirubrobacteraceae bacterium]|nr:hypothetical protein [Solirubrobacteraceae bacterium]
MTHDSYDDSVHDTGHLATSLLRDIGLRMTHGVLDSRPRSPVGAVSCGVSAQGSPAAVDSVALMATAVPSESTPQRLAAIREQLELLADYL